jgi:myo-inositol-1-phosphate synthase
VPLATAADPDLLTHRAFGVPNTSMTPEIWETIEAKANELARKLSVPVQAGQAYAAIDGLDGFEKVETDDTDMQRHQEQFTGHFLLDRDGVVRWASIEGANAGLAGLPLFPTDEELMAAARAL